MGHRSMMGLRRGKGIAGLFDVGVRVYAGEVVDETTVGVYINPCVTVSGVTGIEVRVNQDVWAQVTAHSCPQQNYCQFTTVQTIAPGDLVEWRYLGGSNTIVDCEEGLDVGPLQTVCNNDLGADLGLLLLEDNGFFLLEDDIDGTTGLEMEEVE